MGNSHSGAEENQRMGLSYELAATRSVGGFGSTPLSCYLALADSILHLVKRNKSETSLRLVSMTHNVRLMLLVLRALVSVQHECFRRS